VKQSEAAKWASEHDVASCMYLCFATQYETLSVVM